MTLTPEQFESGFELFRALASDPQAAHASGLEESRAHFLGPLEGTAGDDAQQRAAERRQLEYFLYEHESAGNPLRIIEQLVEPWAGHASRELRAASNAYLESHTGIFKVISSRPGELVELSELAGLASYTLAAEQLVERYEPGDLIVGRLYPLGDGLSHVSPGAGVFRDARLMEAVEADLERLRSSREHAVMRLSQLELEAMFWGAEPVAQSEESDVVGELLSFLREGGVQPQRWTPWLDHLRRSAAEDSAHLPGADDALAEVLEDVAFDTELDLERARMLFQRAWPVLNAGGDSHQGQSTGKRFSKAEPEAPVGVALAMSEFDRDRAAGVDVETSFRDLERKLGLDSTEDDDQALQDVPDFPGVVGAVIEEFLWERGQANVPQQEEVHDCLRLFAGYTQKIGVIENLGPRDLLSFAAFWLPESRQLKSGGEAERLMRGLLAFGRWADEAQGLDLFEGDLEQQLAGLGTSLPRVVVANALLPRITDADGELFRFMGAQEGDFARIRGDDGDDRSVPFDRRLLVLLESGDLLRGYTSGDGAFKVCCCYPPEAAGLRQHKSHS